MSRAALYDTDYLAWTEEQAAALRRLADTRSNLPIDAANLAEEVEDLGKSERAAVFSLTTQIIAHLVALQHLPAAPPAKHWRREVENLRLQVRRRLTPTLQRYLEADLTDAYKVGRNLALDKIEPDVPDAEARVAPACPYSLQEVLGG